MDPSEIQCDICHRPASTRLSFNCTICARNALYEPRLQHAQVLLQKETFGKDVENAVAAAKKATRAYAVSSRAESELSDSTRQISISTALIEQTKVIRGTQIISDHVQTLRQEISAMRLEIAKRKARLHQRRSALVASRAELSQRHTTSISTEIDATDIRKQWDAVHEKTIDSGIVLGREVADLLGLQQRKRQKGVSRRDIYFLGGNPIPDLRDLNNISPAETTAALTCVAHLVHLVSHYLSLRLPAEITLPHREYPLATISFPSSSYQSREVSFLSSPFVQAAIDSPYASRIGDPRPLHHPCLLSIGKKLSLSAKEDPPGYASSVEGITLLAYDVAWMCRTQGLNSAGSSTDEVCAIGRNIWQLLGDQSATTKSPPAQPRTLSGDGALQPTRPHSSTNKPVPSFKEPISNVLESFTLIRRFSHGTLHSFLGGVDGTELMRAWKLRDSGKVIDKIKSMLLSERTGAEWELLEENEWEEENPPTIQVSKAIGTEADEKPISLKATGASRGYDDMRSMTSPTNAIARADDGEEDKLRGTSGWTKLKSRASP